MNYIEHIKLPDCLVIKTNCGQIRIKPYKNNIIRITYTKEEQFSCKDKYILDLNDIVFADWDIKDSDDSLSILTSDINLIVDKKTCSFKYYDKNGELLTKEPDNGGKSLVSVDVEKYVFDNSAEIESGLSVDGLRAEAGSYKKVIDRKAYHTKLEFEWAENEAIYGLGSHEEGIMNLRGHYQYLYQQNMKAVVPVIISTKGYGVLVNTCSLMTFHDDVYGSYIWTDIDDEMDYYFIHGPEFDEIIKEYRFLTGKAPMFPKWMFGYAQSKERYETQEELIEVVKEYRNRKIPLDLIVLDWRSWPGALWGQKSFDPTRFPDPEKMMNDLHDMGAHLMISIWPIMSEGGENHREMSQQDLLLGNQSTYNSFLPKARQLYWKQANEGLFSKGIDAWWCDCTEPFEADWTGEVKPEPEERLIMNTNQAKKYIDPEYINAYSLLHSKGIYEGQRKTTNKKRVVNLTRSSYAGQQRYATITWTGDISAKWEVLKNQIPAGLNFCCTGAPYWTCDIGAFFVANKEQWFWSGDYNDGCKNYGYKELYLRWFQYGAFLPMFRSHGTDTPREVWQFGEPGDIFYDTLKKFIELRYRLLPYIYSVSAMVTHFDYTMMRALPFDFRQDVNTYNIDDQYMFGPAFMVNPVVNPMYYDSDSNKLENTEKSRSVYLPQGCQWYDFWTGEKYDGGQTIKADAPLEIMPLFVRSGSIIPMGPVVEYSTQATDTDIELRIYTGADGEFILYEDEEDNYNYEKGECAFIRLNWNDADKELTIEKREGSFEGMAKEKTFNIVIVNSDNINQPHKVTYTGEKMTVKL